jgi:putative glutathione S-transferase
MLVDGVWQEDGARTSARGRYQRAPTRFHNWVTPDGAPGPSGEGGFEAAPGRYHLYVSHACPWAHRTLIFRKLKKLEDAISVSVVDPVMLEGGWRFSEAPAAIPDFVNGKEWLREIYLMTDPHITGRVTVPVLWDKERKTIVNNESSEIIRMLNSAFEVFTNAHEDYYPERLRAEIDRINAFVYKNVNNGVYRTGFATTQAAYDEAFRHLFIALDELERHLATHRYLAGDRVSEADWRLFTTLVRFDAVYYSHFKCNLRRIADYANLSNYLRELYQWPGVKDTVSFDHIKTHYYASHRTLNPSGIVPRGPALDYDAPHDRARLATREKVTA